MACGTAAGAVTAEGVLSAARALMLAGARAVLATVRPVGDRHAIDVVLGVVHAIVTDRLSPAVALRQVQDRLGTPVAAAFVLVGAWT